MADFPATLWDLNVQDTSNDGPEDATLAQAGGYNEMANEVGAMETELGVSAVSGQSLRGTKASLLARLNVNIGFGGEFLPQIQQLTGASPIAIPVTFNCGIISDVGSSGAPSTHPGNLPATQGGLLYYVVVSGGGTGVRIKAPTGTKIRLGGNLSADGGYIESTDPGANVVIISVSTTLYVAIGPNGIWNLDGA